MSGVETESFKCPNCGANLDPSLPSGHEVFTVRCDYCGKKIRLKQEPAPKRAGASGRRPVVRLRQVKARPVLYVIIGVAVGLPLLGGLLIFSLVYRSTEIVRRAVDEGAGAEAAYPLRCSGSEQINLDNETVRQAGSIVEASGSCKVSINNANLSSGAVAIVAGGSAVVTISNTNLSGARGAITTSGGARVTITDSTVTSRGTAVLARGTSEVALANSRLSGDEAAYAIKGKGKVSTTGTTVEGAVPAAVTPQP